jgi:hypothetical protein
MKVDDDIVNINLRMGEPPGPTDAFTSRSLAKHVEDYLCQSSTSIRLHNFRSHFGWWLKDVIGQCDLTHEWFSQVNRRVDS